MSPTSLAYLSSLMTLELYVCVRPLTLGEITSYLGAAHVDVTEINV